MKKGDLNFFSDRLVMREICISDSKDIVRWRSDPEITKFFFQTEPVTMESHLKWFKSYPFNQSRLDFLILRNEDMVPLGTVGLQEINPLSRSCSVAYMLGERTVYGKGYGLEAVMAACHFAFMNLGMDTVYSKISEENARSMRLIEKAGFSYEPGMDYRIDERKFLVYVLEKVVWRSRHDSGQG